MRKILISTCAILMISATANACGGITIKGNSGASYCLSKHTMNWYSAYAWCHDQGMRLIDMDSVCKSSTSSCSELSLSSDQKTHITDNGGTVGWVWTNTSLEASSAYHIRLIAGEINGKRNGISSRTNIYIYSYALCF